MALKSLPGVESVKVDLASGAVEVESKTELNWEEIKNSLAKVDKIAKK